MKPALFAVVFMFIGLTSLLWASAATTTQSLWSDSTVPQTLSWSDGRNIELGLKFKTDVAGYVTGVRFYKSAQNTGTHTGSLWDTNGNLLGGVTFTNETKSGWQTAKFSQPISIAANVTYVVSYHAPKGHYSLGSDYFKSSAHTNGHLTALKYSVSNPNGVNKASTTATFPNVNGDGDNYYVDVNFSTQLLDPQPAPAAPTGITATASSDATSVSLAWQPSLSQNPVTQYTVYRNGSKIATVGTATSYVDTAITAGTTYNYQVQATDSNGTNSVLSQAATITIAGTTPPTDPGGGTTTGTTTCPLPAYPNPSCTGVPAGTTFSKTISGDYDVTTDGAVIDGVHVTGSVIMHAQNVTIKNSQIDGEVYNDGITNSSYAITDSTVGTDTCSTAGMPSLEGHDFIATRVYLHGHQDGVDMTGGDNVTVRDSYIQPCYQPPEVVGSDGFHSDGVQDQCGATCSNLTLTHNTFDSRAFYKGQPTGNSALNLGSQADGLHLRNVTLADNMFMGGSFTTSLTWDAGNNWTVTNNTWVNNAWGWGPIDAESTCKNQTWSGNKIVTIDTNYAITSTVQSTDCVN